MTRVRKRVHGRYYKLPAFQILAGQLSDAQMAHHLGISPRTYANKVEGWAEFTGTQIGMMIKLLNVTAEEFLVEE
jgi:hypothetical protein